MYEHRGERVLPLGAFLWRLVRHAGVAGAVVLASLVAGMAGYAYFEGLSWVDSFLNAAMLLGGMGPVESPQTLGGKLFAGIYALYAGMVFLVAAGLVLAPVMHRIIHKVHRVEAARDAEANGSRRPGQER